MGLTIHRGPDGLPIFSFEDAPAARRAATPPPRPQRKIPPLIQYRYRAPKNAEPERPRALRQRREHTVTWPGPGLTGVSAGHGTRLKSPQIAGWIPSEETPAAKLREIERENAELVRFIGRSRPSPAMERPQIPRAGGGRGVLPDRLDREARPVVSPSRPARPRRRRRPVAEAPLPADYARYREEVLGDDSDGPDLGVGPGVVQAPAPAPQLDSPPYTPSLRREASEASAFEHGPQSTPTAELLAGVFSPLDEAPPPPELVRLAPAPQKRGGMVPRKSVRASPAKDPRAITAEAERRAVLAATPERTRSGLFLATPQEFQRPLPEKKPPADDEHVSLHTRRKRAARVAREAKLKRQKETAARNAFLDTQLARAGATLAQLSVEKRHRYAHGIEKTEEPTIDMKIRARQEYSELAEFHLTNHERLLEKYAGALMAESRQELDLNGGPMETEYRALVAMEGFKPEPSGEKRYPTLPVVRQALLEDRTVVEERHRARFGDQWLQNRFHELV
jgi:hypothetical protein